MDFFPTTHEKMFLEISIWINYIDFDRVIRILNSEHCFKVSIINTSLKNRIINWAVEAVIKKVWEIIRLRHYRACQFLSAFRNNWKFEPGKTIELCSNLCSSQIGKKIQNNQVESLGKISSMKTKHFGPKSISTRVQEENAIKTWKSHVAIARSSKLRPKPQFVSEEVLFAFN